MKDVAGNPFESIESAHNFVRLLAEAVAESRNEVVADVEREQQRDGASSRRLKALQMAAYTLEKLEMHLSKSRRILNDLRSLRRLLLEERIIVKSSAPVIKPEATPVVKKPTFTVSPQPQNGRSRGTAVAH